MSLRTLAVQGVFTESSVHCPLTALVKLVDAGDVVSAHEPSVAEGHVRILPGDDGLLPVFGEGVATGGHRTQRFLLYSAVHTRTQAHTGSLFNKSFLAVIPDSWSFTRCTVDLVC